MGAHDGRTALVTGGALGIGQGIVRGFIAEGASVVVADTNRPAADALVAELSAAGGRCIATTTDVSQTADAEAAVQATLDAFGGLDVLVNNAGIQPVDQVQAAAPGPEEVWDRIIDVNLKGAYQMTRFAVPALLASGHGVIVNMASVQGLQSMPGVGPYAASKGGLLSLTAASARPRMSPTPSSSSPATKPASSPVTTSASTVATWHRAPGPAALRGPMSSTSHLPLGARRGNSDG